MRLKLVANQVGQCRVQLSVVQFNSKVGCPISGVATLVAFRHNQLDGDAAVQDPRRTDQQQPRAGTVSNSTAAVRDRVAFLVDWDQRLQHLWRHNVARVEPCLVIGLMRSGLQAMLRLRRDAQFIVPSYRANEISAGAAAGHKRSHLGEVTTAEVSSIASRIGAGIAGHILRPLLSSCLVARA